MAEAFAADLSSWPTVLSTFDFEVVVFFGAFFAGAFFAGDFFAGDFLAAFFIIVPQS